MKIACIDKTAALRLALTEQVEAAIESARSVIGHLPLGIAVPSTLDELALSEAPAIALLGQGISLDEISQITRELARSHPNTTRIAILSDNMQSLEALHRLEGSLHAHVFASDAPCRLVHVLYQQLATRTSYQRGRLIALCGAKGGVGTTTVVAGLAHALMAQGIRCLLVDLSAHGALLQYSLLPHCRSAELASLLKQRELPRFDTIENLTLTAPNGLSLLLAPAGGNETRQLWLNSREHLDIGLQLVELLRQRFDVLLVDLGTVEGLLPFALTSRADTIALVSSGEPASMHLCHHVLSQLHSHPTSAGFRILLNHTSRHGLGYPDLRSSLARHRAFREELFSLPSVPYSPHGHYWMGTGNTLYTEGAKPLRDSLDSIAKALYPRKCGSGDAAYTTETRRWSLRKALPLPRTEQLPARSPAVLFELPQLTNQIETGDSLLELDRVNGTRGSLSLEVLLGIASCVALKLILLPSLLELLREQLQHFSR